MYSCGQWCGAWLAPGQNHMYHGRDGLVALWSLIMLEGLVSQILGEVIALLRRYGWSMNLLSSTRSGIPLVGLAAEEAVEAIEPLLQRPLLARRAGGDVLLRHVVVLAQPEGAPAVILEELRHRRALERDASVRTRKSVARLR